MTDKNIKGSKILDDGFKMKGEEDPFEFLDGVSKLSSTPIHYLPGYKMLPGYVEPVVEKEPEPEPDPVYTLEQEKELLRTDPHNFIRGKIKSQVQDVVWLDMLKENLKEMEEKRRATEASYDDRCIVCTMPYGTCAHTKEFLAEKTPIFKDKAKDEVDQELEDMMAVIGGSMEIETHADATSDIDIETMKWEKMNVDKSDKIGDIQFSLATPSSRGWHSSVYFDQHNVVVIFGGFRYKNKAVPQPFGEAPTKKDVEYLNDLYIYNCIGRSWHSVKFHPEGPGGRYGHVAAALDERRMMIYGGRGGNGQFLADTWVYDIIDDSWVACEMSVDSPPPSPRIFSSCAAVQSDAYLFGGTDGVENFGDLWIFHGGQLNSYKDTTSASAMRWERALVVGIPPSPRYGHQIIALHEPYRSEFQDKPVPPRLVVVGGCTVSPQSEIFGTALTPAETKHMLDLGVHLEKQYRREGSVAELGGLSLQSSIENSADFRVGPKDLYQQAARITSHLAALELNTREAEREIVKQQHLMEASRALKLKKAKHSNPDADVVFLDTQEMTWKQPMYPKLNGEFPPSRIHFSAVSTCGYLLVMGGAKPTSLNFSCIDEEHHRIYALDIRRCTWFQAAPRSSTEYLELPISIAEADVTRARNKIKLEASRGQSLGAKNGMTVELAEAQAVEKVCLWRLKYLRNLSENMTEPPAPRWGATAVLCRSRGFLIGGWYNETIVPPLDSYILDLEQEHERRRREDDEFHKKLEEDRQNEEARSSQQNMQSAYELKQLIAAESENAAKERFKMGIEDILSCVPPLTRMNPVTCTKVNAHTVWLQWDPLIKNSSEQDIDPSTVQYKVWMITSYQHLTVEDRVLVMPAAALEAIEAEKARKALGDDDNVSVLSASTAPSALVQPRNNFPSDISLGTSTAGETTAVTTQKGYDFSDYRGPGFPGEIIRVHLEAGLFDVAFDDGQIELNISRKRIKLEKDRWELEEDLEYEEDDEFLELVDPPEGMSMAAFTAKRAEKLKIKEQNSHLTMLNRESYMIREEMSIATKKRINRKLGIRQRKLKALKRFTTPKEVLKQQEEEKKRQSKKRRAIKDAQQAEEEEGEGGKGKGKGKGTGGKIKFDDKEGGSGERKGAEEGDGDAASSSIHSSDDDELSDSDSGSDFELDPEKGFDRKKYMKRLDNPKDMSKVHVTVDVEKPWELVYMGNDNHCEVSGLIPAEVLSQIPDYAVTVQFSIQAIGVDFPTYEHSQLSEPIEVRTRPENNIRDPNQDPISALNTPRDDFAASKNKKKLLDALSAAKKKGGFEAYELEGEGQGEYYM